MLNPAPRTWRSPGRATETLAPRPDRQPNEMHPPAESQAQQRAERGRDLLDAGDYAGAVKELQLAVDREPENVSYLWLLGMSNLGLRKRGGGGDLEIARASFERIAVLEPGNAQGHLGLGLVCDAEGKPDRALEQYRRAYEADPSHPDVYFCFADIYAESGLLDAAFTWITRGLEIHPTCGDMHLSYGGLLEKAGSLGEAASHFELAVNYGTTHPQATQYYGSALLRLGRLEAAVVQLKRSAEQLPRSAKTRRLLGQAYHLLDRLDEAEAAFESAAEIEPDRPRNKLRLAGVLISKGERSRAHSLVVEASGMTPDDEDYPLLGRCLEEFGYFDGAVRALRRAAEIFPGHAQTHQLLGVCLCETEDYEGAVASLVTAHGLAPDDESILIDLGTARKYAGDLAGARAAFERVLALDPDNLAATAALADLPGDAAAA